MQRRWQICSRKSCVSNRKTGASLAFWDGIQSWVKEKHLDYKLQFINCNLFTCWRVAIEYLRWVLSLFLLLPPSSVITWMWYLDFKFAVGFITFRKLGENTWKQNYSSVSFPGLFVPEKPLYFTENLLKQQEKQKQTKITWVEPSAVIVTLELVMIPNFRLCVCVFLVL